MVDFASQIGGGVSEPDVQDFPQSLAGSYEFDEGALFLDLGREGDIFDGTGGTGDTAVFGEGGRDTLLGGANDDLFSGGGGQDRIDAGDGDNFVSGGDEADNILAGVGDDTLDGGTGDDTVDGGDGDNFVTGGFGNDIVFAGDGDDTVFGASGNDVVNGFDGDDFVVGGSGADTIIGGGDDDTLMGGTGGDIFFFDDDFGDDVISDLGPADQIYLTAGINGTSISSPNDLAPFVSGGTDANGDPFTLISIGADTIRIENTDSNDFINNIGSKVVIQP